MTQAIHARQDSHGHPTPSGLAAYPTLQPQRTAVVIVDMVAHQTTPGQGCLHELEQQGMDTDYYRSQLHEEVIPNTQRLATAARTAGAQVVYLRLGSERTDMTDVSRPFQSMLQSWQAYSDAPACRVIPELAPQPGDIDLVKTGSGGFTTSELDTALRQRGITHVLYTGVITHACVLLTLAAGFDLGYYGYLVSDATAALTPQLQQHTEELVTGFLAQVTPTDSLLESLASATNSPDTTNPS